MFDSKNLPLEKRKVLKKSCASGCLQIFTAMMISGFIGIMQLGSMDSPGDLELINILKYIQIFIWAACILFFIINIVYQYLYYKFYYYNFGEESAEIKKGVVAQATGHVYYSRIQNIYLDQDILDRMFQLYDVHYETAGESSAFYSHVDGLNKENADKLIAFILQKAKNNPNGQPNQPIAQTAPLAAPGAPLPPAPPMTNPQQIEIDRTKLPLAPSYAIIMSLQITAALTVFLVFMIAGIVINSPILGLIIIGISFLIIFLISYIYSYYWLKNLNFAFDQEKGTLVTGVLGRETKIVYYNRIQNIKVDQSFYERIFGVNTVGIETAGDSGVVQNGKTTVKSLFAIPGLRKQEAENLKNFLLEHARISRANI